VSASAADGSLLGVVGGYRLVVAPQSAPLHGSAGYHGAALLSDASRGLDIRSVDRGRIERLDDLFEPAIDGRF
jgi:hypothetical protein